MTSIFFFLRSLVERKRQTETNNQHSNLTHSGILNNMTENNEPPRQLKRQLFRTLVKRSSNTFRSNRSGMNITPSMNFSLQPFSAPGGPAGQLSSTLTESQLRKVFSGAPQFFTQVEGHCIGAPHPTVLFPWDSASNITRLRDHMEVFCDWRSITAWPDVTQGVMERVKLANEHREPELFYAPLCRERPHMESMHGIERGTIGYIAALELGVADALYEPKRSLNDSLSYHRHQLLGGKDGIRHLTESRLIERLISAGMTYSNDLEYHRKPAIEFYSDLFTNVLYPPTKIIDSRNPYSLQVQVNVLIAILDSPVWIDFSIVEWRVRLGEVLWGPPIDASSDDHIFIDQGIAQKLGSQKFWLLLQILLSCELLLRLDAIGMNIRDGHQEARQSDIEHIDECATISVRWSLALARVWLDNIELEIVSRDTASTNKPCPGWLATLSRTGNSDDEIALDTFAYVQMQSRNKDRQLSGLLRFAKQLRWPNVEALAERVASNDIAIFDSLDKSSGPGTPPSASTQQANTYFITYATGTKRGASRCRHATAVFHPSGWLSNSYISGLILPGEGLSHLLICALLDNDKTAVSKLGPEVSLYSGFCYRGQSFWSSSCVVGRVLAGGKGASECVGWVSSNIVPPGFGDSWVDINVAPIPVLENYQARPRIWHRAAIEYDSSVTRGADPASVLPSDLTRPLDEPTQRPLHIRLKSLSLSIVTDSTNTKPRETPSITPVNSSQVTKIQTYSAVLNYVLQGEGEEPEEISMPLQYDVYFATAHPCVVSDRAELQMLLAKPLPQTPGQIATIPKKGHFLHKNFSDYTIVSLFDLLMSSSNFPSDSCHSPSNVPLNADPSTPEITSQPPPRVLVIDCTDVPMSGYPARDPPSPEMLQANRHEFGSDIEMLARSLCAYRGWNALISRRGMSCLACAIREAAALQWSVVLRLG